MKIRKKSKICYPNYDKCILGITCSILNYYGKDVTLPTLEKLDCALKKKYKNIVLMIFDGMGLDLMRHNLSPFAFLRRKNRDKITSVFPSTTTAGMTSYYSGLPPISHGWLGWAPYFSDINKIVGLFDNKEYYSGEVVDQEPVCNQLLYTHIFDLIHQVNPTIKTTEVFPSFRENGVNSVQELCDRVLHLAEQPNEQFIFTYWEDPDHLSHAYGPYSKEVYNGMKKINSSVRNMCHDLKNSLVIISADHGHIPVEKVSYVEEYDGLKECLLAPLSLDRRTSAVFLKEGKEQDFLKLFQKYFSKDFILVKSSDAIKHEMFGRGVVHPKAKDFLGDYLIISTSLKVLTHPAMNKNLAETLKGSHAGLTDIEMMVPLVIVKKS